MSWPAHLGDNVLICLAGVFALLVLATLVAFLLKRLRPQRDWSELIARIQSWWVMVAIFSAVLVLSPTAAIAFFGFVSFLALKGYFSIIPTRRVDRRVLFWAYLAIPIQYYWVGSGWYGMFIIFVPVYMLLFLPVPMIAAGQTEGFLRALATVHWGLMTMVFSLSHLAFLMRLPAEGNPIASGVGLLLYLLVLTQLNDVAQYVWGRLFGRRRVVPRVSPGKTWEGLLGGVVTTVLLSIALAPLLTPFSSQRALFVGLLIGVAGFVGDVTLSALKRDLAIKDSGSLIPGHGGILDRIDSLTYTAPLFFHFTRYYYF